MGGITVHRKAYTRKAYTRKDGVRVKASSVPAGTFKVKDRGKRGRTPKSKQWFEPKVHTGWDKDQLAATRRSKLLSSTSKSMTSHNRYLQAGRRAQALANVTTDKRTKQLAEQDAEYFFKKLKGGR
jgi:hypothetical protein